MSTAPPRHIPMWFFVTVVVAISIAFIGVELQQWLITLAGFSVIFALCGVVVKREFFDDNTPDYYDYND